MKKTLSALLVLFGLTASVSAAYPNGFQADPPSSSATVSNGSATNYENWEIMQPFPLLAPVESTNGVPLKVMLGEGFYRVEDPYNEESRFFVEYDVFGKTVMRTSLDKNKTFELLVDGKWVAGKQGAVTKVYLEMKNHFLGTSEIVGVRLVLEAADGGKPLMVVVKPQLVFKKAE